VLAATPELFVTEVVGLCQALLEKSPGVRVRGAQEVHVAEFEVRPDHSMAVVSG